mmetsp:Transcript_58208/g.160905  ORF Transcript_58208/g.160905 Transcript_58208/m.160905 type:complete len:268 (+) Transcript_58208:102-905(+)
MARGRRSPNSYYAKTKMCVFHLWHTCKKGERCSFAHSQEELLTQLPQDFGRSGLRQVMDVEDSTRSLAHTQQILLQSGSDSGDDKAVSGLLGTKATEVGSPFGCLRVKNTFLDFEPLTPRMGVRRSASAPALGEGGGAGGGHVGAAAGPPAAAPNVPATAPDRTSGPPPRALGGPPGNGLGRGSEDLYESSPGQKIIACQGLGNNTAGSQANVGGNAVCLPQLTKPWHNKLFKTRLCTYHAIGRCHKGVACTFAHSEKELVPGPNLR